MGDCMDRLLWFRKPRLLNLLAGWRDLTALVALRASILATTSHLADYADGVADQAESVAFDYAFLLGELQQISEAQTLERAHYYIDRLARSIATVRTTAINDINLNRWKEYDDINTDSLWMIDRRDGSGVHSAGYWGNFVPQIPNQLMRRYTKQGDWVLDTFAGSGTSLIEGQRLGRNVLGVELQPHMVEYANQAVEREPNPLAIVARSVHGDCTTINWQSLLADYGQRHAQLAIMHPPYFDIINFSDDERDLSNAPSVDDFLGQMAAAVAQVKPVLQRGRHLAVIIGDKYMHGEWVALGFRTMEVVQQQGFQLKSIIVKNFEDTTGKRHQKELWRYRALVGGFYIFKHEYIFLFRKK